MIDRWHILISGYTQKLMRPTGTEQLWLSMRPLSSPTTCIQYRVWDDDWAGMASHVSRVSNGAPVVNIYAYSWGAGHGFVTLAKELSRYGVQVSHAVLCDPVYRSTILPTWLPLNPLSMLRLPTITIPPNVRRVSWLRQSQNKPAGHNLKAAHEATRIHEPITLKLNHDQMDDSAEYHAMAMAVATEGI
jgi:pimeloyl-ACP methyl ester carboxylesterase